MSGFAHKVCIVCGVAFLKVSGGKGWCCTRRCGDAFRAWQAALKRNTQPPVDRSRICVVCSQSFQGMRNQSLCSAQVCREAFKRGRYQRTRVSVLERLRRLRASRRAPALPLACVTCGVVFRPVRATMRYCSMPCARKTQKRIHKGVRRAREKGAQAEAIDPMRVFARDDWHCQLCGVSTPRRLRGRMVPTAPELDHIIPLSIGGMHTYDNVQCACRKCNGSKGNRLIGQMRLSLMSAPVTGGTCEV